MNPIQNLLRQTMGLHVAAVGSSLVDRAVRQRMQARGLKRQEEYLRLIKQSPVELHLLVEAVVITETWFFRDRQPFLSLVQLVLSEWFPAHPTGRLRLLSVPCSSGEEPYSMAMALLDAGVPPERFQIDGYDISAHALIAAEQARYGKNSFRGDDLAFRARHFAATDDGYVLNSRVRRQVRFHQGNLLDAECLEESGVYNFIFCRNLLIYFEGATQQKALQKLRRALLPSGVLFVGPAEVPIALDSGFTSANLPLSFACRIGTGPDQTHRPESKTSRQNRLRQASLPPIASVSARKLPTGLDFPGLQTPVQTQADLALAQQLADEGRLAEAAEICEAHLREHGVSAQAYYLLGLVRHAAGADSQASEFYRRALYLKPDHYETLVQWALLSERNGDAARARILQERAERARRSENPGE
ncbi:MAG TPA: CheR family methyltransferase [Verrucomicrobiae bacterium]|jgi:chemotaxis protein methyltransferase WspC|nr:CheR family methyltransferase [Verrucomicrobiae bacterium]